MPIQQTIGPGTPTSSAANPAETISEYYVGQYQKGSIVIEQLAPGGEWRTIDVLMGAGALNTPDPAVQYRFHSQSLEEDVPVYFGP